MALIRSGESTRLVAGVLDTRLLFGVAFAFAFVLAWLPVEWTIGRFIYDDMFYYLRVAQHIVAGHGSTFDGVAPTNGYHPLWMMICVALALLLSGDMLVHGVLTVAAVLHVAQGVVLSRILSHYVRPAVMLFLTALYLLNWRTCQRRSDCAAAFRRESADPDQVGIALICPPSQLLLEERSRSAGELDLLDLGCRELDADCALNYRAASHSGSHP